MIFDGLLGFTRLGDCEGEWGSRAHAGNINMLLFTYLLLLLFTSHAPIPPIIGRFYLLIIDCNHYFSFLNENCWSYRLPTTASVTTTSAI